jgi:hypothetical protein
VSWSLGTGSHTLEFAYREVGTSLTRILIDTTPNPEPGYGLCFD